MAQLLTCLASLLAALMLYSLKASMPQLLTCLASFAFNNVILVTYCSKWNRLSLSRIAVRLERRSLYRGYAHREPTLQSSYGIDYHFHVLQ
jgi:hypothetical protein